MVYRRHNRQYKTILVQLTVRGKGLLLRELGESRVLLQGELKSWSF